MYKHTTTVQRESLIEAGCCQQQSIPPPPPFPSLVQRKQMLLEQLIENECKTMLIQINPNPRSTKLRIQEVLKTIRRSYSLGIGCVVARLAQTDVQYCSFIIKFHLAILDEPQYKIARCQSTALPLFRTRSALVDLLSVSVIAYLQFEECKPKFPRFKESMQQISSILTRYTQSMLLEYVPNQYVEGVVEIYMQKNNNKQMQYKMPNCSPYQEYILIVLSLVAFIAHNSNPVNFKHFLILCRNPCVEWPIVIAHRYQFHI